MERTINHYSFGEEIRYGAAKSEKTPTSRKVVLPGKLVSLHHGSPYLCSACSVCPSGVRHQGFVDKISRGGCSTCCQLMFLVADCWEIKQHAVEIVTGSCSYKT